LSEEAGEEGGGPVWDGSCDVVNAGTNVARWPNFEPFNAKLAEGKWPIAGKIWDSEEKGPNYF
jgi:hypothetical protein